MAVCLALVGDNAAECAQERKRAGLGCHMVAEVGSDCLAGDQVEEHHGHEIDLSYLVAVDDTLVPV